MAPRTIYITEQDATRLRRLLAARDSTARDQDHLEMLSTELDRAMDVDAAEIPPGVVTMGTRVRVQDLESREYQTYTISYPWDADVASDRVSVLAPVGTALLGYAEGDTIEWPMPGGMRRLRVEKVLYQPEAAHRARATGSVPAE
jgi:regulator of nucleoside diphosphate kinase